MPEAITVAQLPSATLNKGKEYLVTDSMTNGDCSVGGGTRHTLCISNGAGWLPAETLSSDVDQRVQVQVDFGPNELSIARQFVAATWVTSASVIDCDVAALPTADHDPDDIVCEGLIAYATSLQPGVGFTVMVRAPTQTWGKYLVNCIGR